MTVRQTPPFSVEDTALVTASFRSSFPEISHDPLSRHLVTPAAAEIHADVIRHINADEPLAHAVRNRFFLDQLRDFFRQYPDGVFINLGAGFSMYPYLLDSEAFPLASFIEVDTPAQLKHKSRTIAKLQKIQGHELIPQRDVMYVSCDLCCEEDLSALASELHAVVEDRATFVLLEGVLYFLSVQSLDKLFHFLSEVQVTARAPEKMHLLGCVAYAPEIQHQESFRLLSTYIDKNFQAGEHARTSESGERAFLPRTFFENLMGYRLTAATSTLGCVEHYGVHEHLVNRERLLEEQFYLLQRR